MKKLKVLLINMPLRESALPNCAPLGPALLAARLKNDGHNITIVDLNVYRIKDEVATYRGLVHGRHLNQQEWQSLLTKHFKVFGNPDLVGLSGKITTLKWQQDVSKFIKEVLPESTLISGGGLATEFGNGLFNWVPELDAVCHSEGDDVILNIVKDVSYGTINKFYQGYRPKDLDALPLPAWDLLEKDVNGFQVFESYLKNEIWGLEANNSSATPFKMTRSINTVSSRGCPYSCNFCFRGAFGERNYGTRSAENLYLEFQNLYEKYNIDFVGLLDDNFLVQKSRIEDMIPFLGPFCEKNNIKWGTHGRLDEAADLRPDGKGGSKVSSRKRVDAMKEAGCAYIGFGAESASPKTLNNMGKGGFMLANGTTRINGRDVPTTMLHGYKNTIAAGIHGNCTWIMGYPGEGLEELKDSIAFIQWQRTLVQNDNAVNKCMFTATAYPGTDLFKHPKVKRRLEEGFGVEFEVNGNPKCNDMLKSYVLELDDATKILDDKNGKPVYFGEMPLDQFLKVKNLINEEDLEGVLAL